MDRAGAAPNILRGGNPPPINPSTWRIEVAAGIGIAIIVSFASILVLQEGLSLSTGSIIVSALLCSAALVCLVLDTLTPSHQPAPARPARSGSGEPSANVANHAPANVANLPPAPPANSPEAALEDIRQTIGVTQETVLAARQRADQIIQGKITEHRAQIIGRGELFQQCLASGCSTQLLISLIFALGPNCTVGMKTLLEHALDDPPIEGRPLCEIGVFRALLATGYQVTEKAHRAISYHNGSRLLDPHWPAIRDLLSAAGRNPEEEEEPQYEQPRRRAKRAGK